MRPQIEPYKRLYRSGKLTLELLQNKVSEGKLTEAEYEYITKED